MINEHELRNNTGYQKQNSHLLTVNSVVCHGGVYPDNYCTNSVVVLVQEELDQEEIQDGDSEDTSPEGGVGTGEGSIRKGEDGDDHEEDEDTDEAGEDVVVPVRVIPGEGRVGQGQHADDQQADGVGLVEEF